MAIKYVTSVRSVTTHNFTRRVCWIRGPFQNESEVSSNSSNSSITAITASSNSSITAITASSNSSITTAVLRLLLPAATAVLLFLRHESRNEGIKHSWKFHNTGGVWTPVAWTKIQCSNHWAKESTLWRSCQGLNIHLEAMHNLPR